MQIIDEENLLEKVPKNFKSVFLGGISEQFLIAGGFDAKSGKSSKKAFLLSGNTSLIKGSQGAKLHQIMEMYVGR